ncbi:MAG TPA: DUF3307 domain-containing protein [Flavobacteriaceae bacterium]|nr:DUF3307 domain-containing protein [Flavobacteriaceae bacterium]
MMVMVKLILAHLLGDFLLQPTSWVKEKETSKIKSPKLYLHVLLHGVLVYLFVGNWSLAIAVLLVHFAIDTLKVYAQKETTKVQWFWIDQSLHILSLLNLYYFWFRPDWQNIALFETPIFWIYATAILFLTSVSGILIQVVLKKWSDDLVGLENDSLKDAGRYIGILERLLIFLLIIAGYWEPIGFLIAAKSIFRFGDLKEAKDRKLTEYILMGTLLSFTLAIVVGVVVKYLSFTSF